MRETFTEQQREIVARKMGYDGPMQMFDEYLASTPSDANRYSAITSKYAVKMAQGGVVKMVAGGAVGGGDNTKYYSIQPEGFAGGGGGGARGAGTATTTGITTTGTTTTGTTAADATGSDTIPVAPTATVETASQTDKPTNVTFTKDDTTKEATATAIPTTDVKQATTPTAVKAGEITAATAQTGVETALDKTKAVQGVVSAGAKPEAATMEPTKTAVSGLEAAQGVATQVVAPTARVAQAGEMVTGTAVDQAKVEAALAKNVAAQGIVTEEMTTSGQLNKLMASFDAGAPPPWAAASMRAVTAQLAARGLVASSMAGQALIQAALESSIPIASADAKVFTEMGLTNLSNRQAMAIETGKQRAAFLGQEFDQTFQTKVLNAAKISDIANRNFDASVTVALENSRLANSMSIANLSARNAMVLAEAAQIANLETANLNNRQQVAVETSRAFLAMDLKNTDIASQTNLIKAQVITSAIISDTAAANAAKATNAANTLEADKINATLAFQASQYNASEQNRVTIANNAAVNEIAKFNANEANRREEFNSQLSVQIDLANAKILADVSTANTREANAINAVNAKNATDLSASTYSQQSQTYRDLLELSYKSGENDKDRLIQLATATITANASKTAAEFKAATDSSTSWGQLLAKWLLG